MTDNQPPTTPLPDDVENWLQSIEQDLRWVPFDNQPHYAKKVVSQLRQDIAAALTEARDEMALRERCERLRRTVELMWEYGSFPNVGQVSEALEDGDLADDIIQPTPEDVLK